MNSFLIERTFGRNQFLCIYTHTRARTRIRTNTHIHTYTHKHKHNYRKLQIDIQNNKHLTVRVRRKLLVLLWYLEISPRTKGDEHRKRFLRARRSAHKEEKRSGIGGAELTSR